MRKFTLSVSTAVSAFLAAPFILVAPQPGYSQTLEEITVTARKTTESLQEVPLAITALGAEEIDRLGLKDLNQITQQDTSVQFDEGFTPSDTRITIRGLSPTRGRPNAATLVDGIDVSSEAVSNAGGSLLINPRLVDVQRIEIVKGPQSALYGRSAFAGAIQYVTKDPSDVLEGDLGVDYTSEDQKELKGSVSIPLTDTLGVLANGLVYDSRGIYRNDPTGAYLGGAEGYGTSLTVKWEPTDTVGVKWRTEYTHDEYAPPAQVLLSDYNGYIDVGNSGIFGPDDRVFAQGIAPGSSKCNLTGSGSLPINSEDGGGMSDGLPGPLNDPGCDTQFEWSTTDLVLDERYAGANLLTEYMNNAYANNGDPQSMVPGFGAFACLPNSGCLNGYDSTINLGQYDPSVTKYANVWNKQITNLFVGTIPDADKLGNPSISPNYQTGIGAQDKANAIDYDGTEKEVFRTSLVVDWAINDDLTFTSLSGYTNADVTINQDIGKRWVDECGADLAYLDTVANPLIDPSDASAGSVLDYLQNDLGLSDAQAAAFAPCSAAVGKDGVNDLDGVFTENSDTGTKQLSQELRLAWQMNDSVNFTTGVQYWGEDIKVDDWNSVLKTGGTQCFYTNFFNGSDQAYQKQGGFGGFGNYNQGSFQLNPMQDACGSTNVQAAYWADEAFAGRLDLPSNTKRDTDHYSWYGSLDLDVTDRLSVRLEARYTKEDNSVTGAVVTPCYDGQPYYNKSTDPNNYGTQNIGTVDNPIYIPADSYYDNGDASTGNYIGPVDQLGNWAVSGCSNGGDNPGAGFQPNKNTTANSGQGTGPSAVLICGLSGRCDNMAFSQLGSEAYLWSPNWTLGDGPDSQVDGPLKAYGADNSYWPWGFLPGPRNQQTLERTDRYWAPKVTVEYLFTDDIMGYFSWSRGIKPGGFSLLTSGAFGLDANLDGNYDEVEFTPERLDVWEVGTKTTLFDGRVRLNGSAFFQDFKDKQVTVQKVTDGTTGTEVVNISGSEVRGFELDATWLATDNLRLQVGYTFLDSEYTDYTIITPSVGDIARIAYGPSDSDCSEVAEIPGSTDTDKQFGCVMSFNGNELERAPRHAWLANLNYTAPLMDTGLEWFTEVNYRYQDARWMEAFNIVKFPSYSLTDLRLGLLAESWDVQLYVNNVFDDDTILSGGPNPGIANGDFNIGIAARNQPPKGVPAADCVLCSAGPGVVAGPNLPSDIYANLPNPRIAGLRANFRFGQ